MTFPLQNGWPTKGDLLRNDPINMSHFPAHLHYNTREQSREPGLGESRISNEVGQCTRMFCTNASYPLPTGWRRGVVAGGIGGGGSNLCDWMVRHQKAPHSKMLLPFVLTIGFTQSKVIYPVIRHRRCVSVKSEPQR